MNILIDDNVPLPQPDKADTWVTGKPAPKSGLEGWQTAIRTLTPVDPDEVERPACAVPKTCKANYAKAANFGGLPERYPAETTYDKDGVPTADCLLVGGPLNGQHGPIVGTAKTVELEVYAADGSVSSVEFYELGAKGDLQGRYWAGTKGKQQCDLCKDWFALGVVSDKGYCAECQAELIEVRRNLNRT